MPKFMQKVEVELDQLLDSILQELSISVDKTTSKRIQDSFSTLVTEFQRTVGVTDDFNRVRQVIIYFFYFQVFYFNSPL